MKRTLLSKPINALAATLAVLVTLATGNWSNNGAVYGFPLPWKTVNLGGGICPPVYEIACFIITSPSTTYNWTFFALDVAFYLALGYSGLFAHDWLGRNWLVLRHLLTRLLLLWRRLATTFKVSFVMGVLGGIYFMSHAPWTVTFLLLANPAWPTDWWFSLAAVFVFLTVPTISVGGAIALLTLPMKDNERGILAFFVTVSSFVPLFFLGFEILYWVLRFWQFATIALLWSMLLLMAARVIRGRQPSRLEA